MHYDMMDVEIFHAGLVVLHAKFVANTVKRDDFHAGLGFLIGLQTDMKS